jgi:photosynthetic reaction center cytochrome c subunit
MSFLRPAAYVLATAVMAAALATLLAGCERPPIDSVQHGYRGTGMVQVYNPRIVDKQAALNTVPESPPQVPADGPKAGEVYQNVKVLGSLSVGEFTRLMVAMTTWVAPEQGCGYCHNLQNLADDSVYTKVVARKMIQMTQNVNSQWKSHVAETGVTCFTCHRGQPVPARVWFTAPAQDLKANFIGDKAEQNEPAKTVGLSSLPYDPFTPYLLKSAPIRVIGNDVLPGVQGANNRSSIKQAEFTYGLMMHMSEALGVNCTYCHNSRSFASWEGPTQRVTAWHGIQMVRDINLNYLEPLTATFPRERLGATGDVAKTYCATCHQGAYKPLYGASMLKVHPELAAPLAAVSAAAPAAAPATAAAALSGTLARVLFAVGSAEITPQSRAAIANAAGQLAQNTSVKVELSGFADRTGNTDQNFALAKRRAEAVRDALRAAGVAGDRINLRKPEFAVGGTSADARRVEIVVAGG